MLAFQRVRSSLSPGTELDPHAIASPFIAVVRSEETSGLITALALGALHKLIVNGLCGMCGWAGGASDLSGVDSLFRFCSFSDSCPIAAGVRTLAAVAEAANQCRFEATDSRRDELVLLNILHVRTITPNPPSPWWADPLSLGVM